MGILEYRRARRARTGASTADQNGMTRLTQRLWWRIWLAVLATVVLAIGLSFVLLVLLDPARSGPRADAIAYESAAALPAAAAPVPEQQAALEAARRRSDALLSLFDQERRPIASAGRLLPAPRQRFEESHWMTRFGRPGDAASEAPRKFVERAPLLYALRLDDGRWLVVGRDLRPHRSPEATLAWLLLLAAVAGIGAYPVVRRLTRRLERLQHGVEELGRGDLRTRVLVEGKDEVAQLATSFNTAAGRIEQLLLSHRALLANASHELRSPLARVRMAIEMLSGDASAQQKQALQRELRLDIAELDALIDEILLASRLDAQSAEDVPSAPFETVDLTALVAEEAARFDADVTGGALSVLGDARLLRRLARNLLENASRYGGAQTIEVELHLAGDQVELNVSDRGPGVPDEERERIFEPFYRARGAAESAGGVGLGLALVRLIAQRHGGSVVCLPRAGGGSQFRVTLPQGGVLPQ